MPRYIALMDRSADGGFGLVFPDLPGCAAQGASFEEAYDAAVEAAADWAASEAAEGRQVPAPSALDALTPRPEVAEDLAAGASLVFIPLVRMSGRAARANMTMDEGLLAEIDDDARRLKVTRTAWIASAARAALRRSA